MAYALVWKDGTIFADEQRSELAVSAQSDSAPHIPFHREVDLFRHQTAALEILGAVFHHDFRTAYQADSIFFIELHQIEKFCHNFDISLPGNIPFIDRNMNLDTGKFTPLFQFDAKEQVERFSCAVEQYDATEILSVFEHVVQHRPERSESDSTRHHKHIAAFERLDGPSDSERAPNTDNISASKL
jgi:hypothetical protein